jgi:hypothetical protein
VAVAMGTRRANASGSGTGKVGRPRFSGKSMSASSIVLEREAAPSLARADSAQHQNSAGRDTYCAECGGVSASDEMIEDCSIEWSMLPFPMGSWAC